MATYSEEKNPDLLDENSAETSQSNVPSGSGTHNKPPCLIVLGMAGSGKTTFVQVLKKMRCSFKLSVFRDCKSSEFCTIVIVIHSLAALPTQRHQEITPGTCTAQFILRLS